MKRLTYVVSSEALGIKGQLLITVYDGEVTIAYRERTSDSWGPPHFAEQRP